MPTAIQMINQAYILTNQTALGETVTADEANYALYRLNAMLDSWQTQRLNVYYILSEAFTLTPGDGEYTIGTGGNFNTVRPIRIDDSCFLRLSDVDYPVALKDEQAYAAIPVKNIQSLPSFFYYQESYPLGIIRFNYLPDQAYSFHIKSTKQLQSFTSLTDSLALPPGYQQAIEMSLAEILCIGGGYPISPDLKKAAYDARIAVKTINSPAPIMQSEAAYMTRRDRYNIYVG